MKAHVKEIEFEGDMTLGTVMYTVKRLAIACLVIGIMGAAFTALLDAHVGGSGTHLYI